MGMRQWGGAWLRSIARGYNTGFLAPADSSIFYLCSTVERLLFGRFDNRQSSISVERSSDHFLKLLMVEWLRFNHWCSFWPLESQSRVKLRSKWRSSELSLCDRSPYSNLIWPIDLGYGLAKTSSNSIKRFGQERPLRQCNKHTDVKVLKKSNL